MEVRTESGFVCNVNTDALDDWDFTMAAMNASDGDQKDALRLTMYMVEHMLSKEDAERLKDHVRTEDGRVPTSRIMQEVDAIFTSISEGKKSASLSG